MKIQAIAQTLARDALRTVWDLAARIVTTATLFGVFESVRIEFSTNGNFCCLISCFVKGFPDRGKHNDRRPLEVHYRGEDCHCHGLKVLHSVPSTNHYHFKMVVWFLFLFYLVGHHSHQCHTSNIIGLPSWPSSLPSGSSSWCSLGWWSTWAPLAKGGRAAAKISFLKLPALYSRHCLKSESGSSQIPEYIRTIAKSKYNATPDTWYIMQYAITLNIMWKLYPQGCRQFCMIDTNFRDLKIEAAILASLCFNENWNDDQLNHQNCLNVALL